MILSKSTSIHISCSYQIVYTILTKYCNYYVHIYIYIEEHKSVVHLGILSSNETWLENVNAHGNTPVYGGRPHGINMHKLLLDGGIISTICIYIYIHIWICTLPRPLFHTESVTTQSLASVPRRLLWNYHKIPVTKSW